MAHRKDSYDYYKSPTGEDISKVSIFIGPNASGKTNIMRLFTFLSVFLRTSRQDRDPGDLYIPYKNFFDNQKDSTFKLEFELDKEIFIYSLILNRNIIKKERLQLKKIEKYAKPIIIFDRKLDAIEYLHEDYFKNLTKSKLPNIRSDISFIPFIRSLYDIEVIKKVFDYFNKFNTNINEVGEINIPPFQGEAIDLYLNDPELKEKMISIIRNFDLGIDSIEINKETLSSELSKYEVYAIHKYLEENKKLGLRYESSGTQHLFFILAKLLKTLKEEGVAIIDEFERGLHTESLNKIMTYFIDENSDSKSQFLFTSHSHDILMKRDMHQIYLVGKNQDNGSYVKRLNDVPGVRTDDNFKNKYLSGSYGAFPKITIK